MNQLQSHNRVPLGEIAEISLGLSTSRIQSATNKLINEGKKTTNPLDSGDAKDKLHEEARLIQVRDIVEETRFALERIQGSRFRPFAGRLLPLERLEDVYPKVAGFQWDRFRVQEGDVLLSSKGSLLKTAIVGAENAGGYATSNIIILRPKRELVLPRILLATIRREDTDSAIKTTSRSNSTALSLTTRDIAKIKVPLPSMEIQIPLAEVLEASELYVQESLTAIELKSRLVWTLLEDALGRPNVVSKGEK